MTDPKEPSFDADGYPTDATLRTIRRWPWQDLRGLFAYVAAAWRYPDYVRHRGRRWRFATGGWSGNESLMAALMENRMARALAWQSSHRGGKTVWEVPKMDKTKPGDPR